jgi:hypothetical protein
LLGDEFAQSKKIFQMKIFPEFVLICDVFWQKNDYQAKIFRLKMMENDEIPLSEEYFQANLQLCEEFSLANSYPKAKNF